MSGDESRWTLSRIAKTQAMASPGTLPTIRRRWTVSILVAVAAGLVAQTILIGRVNEYGARMAASGWIHNSGERTLPVFFAQVASSLDTLAHTRALGPLLVEAIAHADADAFDVLVHEAEGAEHWSALGSDGAPFTTVRPLCSAALLAPVLAAAGRPVTVVCNGLPILAVAERVSTGVSSGWLLVERTLDGWFVEALSTCTGPELALVGPDGHVAGSAKNLAGTEAMVTLSPELAALLVPGSAPFYGKGTVHVPSYAGYNRIDPDVWLGRGSTVVESDVAVVAIPGLEGTSLRLVFWVPLAVMRIGAGYSTLVLVIGAGIVGLLPLLFAARLSGRLTRPLGALADAAERVTAGDLDVEVPVQGDRETARLGATFALMLRSLREMTADQEGRNLALTFVNEELFEAMKRLEVAQAQLVQAGKLAAVGTLVAGLSHELNNPIAVIVGYVQGLLRTTPPSAPARAGLLAIERQAQRCAALVKTLLDFSRDRPPHREKTPIAEVLNRVEEIAGLQAKQAEVVLHRAPLDEDLPAVDLSPEEITSAVLNLVSNAVDASPPGATVTVSARAAAEDGRPGVELIVKDEGTGIGPDVLPHVFDAFYTTKPPGRGTGLGLPLARQIADAHGGRVTLQSETGRGTTARLWLPLSATVPDVERTLLEPGSLGAAAS